MNVQSGIFMDMVQSRGMQEHMAAAILEYAARALAQHGDSATLADIAEATGISRSTLYRYFPNRDALVSALAERAAEELRERIREAELDTLSVPDAIARITRGLIATGSKYVAIASPRSGPGDSAELQVTDPILRLFERGVAEGSLRGDVPAAALFDIYSDLVKGGIQRAAHNNAGVEQASAAVLAVFLHGALTIASA